MVMTHRCLTELDAASEPEAFYFKALQYGNYLWTKGHSGRAILAITRALYSNVPADAAILQQWPLPYAALTWIIRNHLSDDFPGNPRISFKNQATRLRGERQHLRRARAWAVWAIICRIRPTLPSNDTADVMVPSQLNIFEQLTEVGHPTEATDWEKVLQA